MSTQKLFFPAVYNISYLFFQLVIYIFLNHPFSYTNFSMHISVHPLNNPFCYLD